MNHVEHTVPIVKLNLSQGDVIIVMHADMLKEL